jgi:hypothetical protein
VFGGRLVVDLLTHLREGTLVGLLSIKDGVAAVARS